MPLWALARGWRVGRTMRRQAQRDRTDTAAVEVGTQTPRSMGGIAVERFTPEAVKMLVPAGCAADRRRRLAGHRGWRSGHFGHTTGWRGNSEWRIGAREREGARRNRGQP